MTPDHDDPRIARLWRGVSSETPGVRLDAQILQAARMQHKRRRLAPLAAALAACLVLALYAVQLQPAPSPPPAAASVRYQGTGAVLADPEAMRQMMIRQMPGGAAFTEFVSP